MVVQGTVSDKQMTARFPSVDVRRLLSTHCAGTSTVEADPSQKNSPPSRQFPQYDNNIDDTGRQCSMHEKWSAGEAKISRSANKYNVNINVNLQRSTISDLLCVDLLRLKRTVRIVAKGPWHTINSFHASNLLLLPI